MRYGTVAIYLYDRAAPERDEIACDGGRTRQLDRFHRNDCSHGHVRSGEQARMPLAPSTRISLAPAAVGATSATLIAAPAATFSHTNSTSDRVFPNPRPASSSQVNQSLPGGGSGGRPRQDRPAVKFVKYRCEINPFEYRH
jgi:hypothetical protein